jgi:hypothetical protein
MIPCFEHQKIKPSSSTDKNKGVKNFPDEIVVELLLCGVNNSSAMFDPFSDKISDMGVGDSAAT